MKKNHGVWMKCGFGFVKKKMNAEGRVDLDYEEKSWGWDEVWI